MVTIQDNLEIDMKISIIGLGYWGKIWKEVLIKHDVLHKTCDREGADTTDWREAIKGADGVIIATPPNTHEYVSEDCLNEGIYVLCEKPISIIHDRLMQGYQMRVHPNFKKLRINPKKIDIIWEGRQNNDVWNRIAPHALDIMEWVVGPQTEEIKLNIALNNGKRRQATTDDVTVDFTKNGDNLLDRELEIFIDLIKSKV